MTPAPSILRASDFGDFEPELKQAFRDAFHFEWDAGVDDSPDEHERRKSFARFVRAARTLPETQASRGLELMRECYELGDRITKHLWPEELLRGDLNRIWADLRSVGEQIAKLPRTGWTLTLDASPEPLCRSADGFQVAWTLIEERLHERLYATQLSPSWDEISRLRDLAARTRSEVDLLGRALSTVSLEGKNEVAASERAEMISALAKAVERVSQRLAKFSGKCVQPSAHEESFYRYLERISRDLLVRTNSGRSPRAVKHWTEVPASALIMPRELPERRAAVLQGLCVSDPEFFPLLPSTVRRDHNAPATRGGKNNRNWVLRGVTAALVLLELVDRDPDARKTDGKDLFDTTLKQVDNWIRTQAASGFFFVDADAGEPTLPGDRPRSVRSLPLVARYPMNSVDEEE